MPAGQLSSPASFLLTLEAQDERWLIAIAQRVVGDRERAEDICQDVLLRHWSRPGDYDPLRGSFLAYLTVLCRSRAHDVMRSDIARRQREERSHQERPPRHEPDPADSLADDQLAAALRTLRPAEAQAILLAYRDGLCYTEVARRLDVPEGTVKSQIRRGLANLHHELVRPRVL